MARWWAFVGFVLLFPLPSGAQDKGAAARYQAVIEALEKWLPREIEAKGIPALSVALVDDQTLVWAKGFGHADPHAKELATADTVYRVGSVSKPITALLLMMLVEAGLIDLDAPVQKYLPDFKPKNTSGKQITLRQMLCHKSGLVRESPVGNYFDASEPSLAATVASLNQTELVYVPETTTSYSNAALATVGLVLEKTQNEPFARLMKRRLLDPLGMKSSGYELTPDLRKNLAHALMWTYHGRTFPAPTWELGMPSAGSLYSTVKDQARVLGFLFAWGKTAEGKQLLKKETLESMYRIQFAKPGEKAGFGLSWFVSEFEGRRRIGHGGAVYGFATDFSALPDDKLGVVAIASKDVANAVTRRISDFALRGMLAVREGKPVPALEQTKPLTDVAWMLAGRYRSDKNFFDLEESNGRLYLWPGKGGVRLEVRSLLGDDLRGKELMIDDIMGFGPKLTIDKDRLIVNKEVYKRTEIPKPEPCPEKWRGLIGEYGPDHNVLYILEKDGQLHALIEWVFLYPLKEIAPDVYQFPDFGLYHGDKVLFRRDKTGRCTSVIAASVPFERRVLSGEQATFKIRPLHPVEKLRQAALAAQPPVEKDPLLKKPELVEVTSLEPTVKLDIRYAGDNNFLGTPLYSSAKAFLQRPAAESLVRAHRKLTEKGYGLLIHDAYRPWYVTKVFWDATPAEFKLFVADPMQGSRHNRGCAVDVTLYDRQTGKAVEMPGGYDEFSDRSYADYPGGTSLQRWHRNLLRRTLESEGFTVYHAEWWHYDHHTWRSYPILNRTFEALAAKK